MNVIDTISKSQDNDNALDDTMRLAAHVLNL